MLCGTIAAVFSARTQWNLTANRLSQLLERKRWHGEIVLDLTESNPTRAGLVAAADLLAPLSAEAASAYEPAPLGLPAARAAVAAEFAGRGLEVSEDRVVLTAGTSESYAFLFKLLCDPGDVVLVPRPSYPLFEFLARLESVGVATYPLVHDGEWHVDPTALRSALDEQPRARAICVVHPNNPTGSFVKRQEAVALQALAAQRGVAIVSDEVFADYALVDDPRRFPSFAGEMPVLAFTLGGLSKSCGLPQMKLGWIVVSGPPDARREALARLEVIADTYLSVSTPVQLAAPSWLARRAELTRPIAARIASNLATLRELLLEAPLATLLGVEGGWYAVLRVPATRSEEELVVAMLERHGVLVHPGFFFDFAREAYLVLSLLPRSGVFREGAARLLRALE
jgi:alanine-synthesizing transaminase